MNGPAANHRATFTKLWQQLQGKKPHLPHFLTEVSIDGIRGPNQEAGLCWDLEESTY